MTGIITKAISGFYYVAVNGEIYECKARGVFRKENISPCVGDYVEIELTDSSHGVLVKIHPRKNHLIRPVISNLDKLFIVSSFEKPAPNALMIDRLIALCEMSDIEPIIVFNKSDLGDFSYWENVYKKSGFKVYTLSCINKESVEALKEEIKNCICAFAGNSGVGKSSILSILLPEFSFETGNISEKLGRGRHTTRQVELFTHKFGGYVADTPGFAAIENDKFDLDFKEKLPSLFREFEKYINDCYFTGCSHTCEKGCAVCEAVKKGEIPVSRHESYVSLYNEYKDIKPWQIKNKE